jgi:2-keto-4-pentenoate hydratase/2-oxohepta-3-ene-1,7-dioic acid hydratase in catechol pathway
VAVAEDARSVAYATTDLLSPVPRPSQIFGIGLNYADHAAEAGLEVPDEPLVFTKFPSSLTSADVEVRLSGDRVDWEAELVVVVGRTGRDVAAADAWDHVAGLTVGQDLSDRAVQWAGGSPQFNLGKSFAGYAPVGPAVVSVDEVRAAHDPDALAVRCTIEDGSEERVLQDGNSRNLIFSVPELIARLSAIVELRAGDLIFTGTPAGVGAGLEPPVFLRAGQTLTTEIEGLGTIRQRLV